MSAPIDDPKQLIAIVGMAARFPQAPDLESFWQLLMNRGDAIQPVPPERWDRTEQLDPEKPVQAVGGFLDGVDQFDPMFFGISPREAEDIDPQQRLLLEASWRALEDGGQRADALRESRTGVYVGASWHDYEILRKDRGMPATQHSAVGNALDMLAARVSYFYKLRGPSLTVETGCSSSLVALHLACQALRQGEIGAAIVGGANLILAPDVSIGLTHFGGLSPDGRCKAFAASANGFVRGEGVVALYVKTLADALADGDHIRGVIAGTAVNNDGGGDSLVTPAPAGQEDLLRQVYGAAGVPLDELVYLEAHGTGTSRGDPVEAGAIGRALAQRRDRARGPLAIGSVKTNIGHLEATAGLAALAKVLLSLEHRVVPPNLHGDELNPEIPFDELGLRVVREPLALPADTPVYMGVNSFGWGGTNAHVILTSAPAPAERPATTRPPGAPVLVPVSAHQSDVLRQRVRDLQDTIAQGEVALADLAGTLAWQRGHFPNRAAFVVETVDELRTSLEHFAAQPDDEIPDVVAGRAHDRNRVAFVFPGQGSQWLAMGHALFAESETFAASIRRCAEALAPFVTWDLVGYISGEAGNEWLSRVDILQPTLWAMSVALAELWQEAGIEPDVVVGHSQGEVAAATVAGILSYEDAARIIARRSAIARSKSGQGLMLAVDLDVESARAALAGFEESVSLAVNNGPTSCVLSGDADSVSVLKELLEADDIFCRLVKVDYASHSPQMDDLKDELLAALEPVQPRPGKALMSTVLARHLDGTEMDAAYWVRNLREPVLFADTMGKLFDEGVTHVIEVSAHSILVPALEQLAALRAEPVSVLSTLRRDAGTPRHLELAFARAYVAGLMPFGGLPRNASVPLPSYPWQRRSFWVSQGRRKGALKSGLALSLIPSMSEQDAWQGTLELGIDENPWLEDHKVHDAIVLPGAAMMALAVNAARARAGTMPRELAGFEFQSDLTLGDEPARLSVLWRDDVTEGGSFTLLSLATGATAWTRHASARIRQQGQPAPQVSFPADLRAKDARDVDEFYSACAARGLNYGPAFQSIQRLHVDGDAALGQVRLSESCRIGARPHGLHPALWDGALQVSIALCGDDDAVVPTGVERISVLQDIDEPVMELWSHVVRRGELCFDLTFYDASEQPLMVLEGLTLQALASTAPAVSDAARVHRLQFKEAARSATGTQQLPWVVCSEPDDDSAKALASALEQAGISVTRAQHRSSGEDPRAEAWLDQLRAGDEVTGIVFVAPSAAAGPARQEQGLLSLASLVKACVAMATPLRLVIVTADAQGVVAGDQPDPGAAMYWGFVRVLCQEHAELQPRVIDVASADDGWATACAAELMEADDEDQVGLRGERRLVGRLVRGEATEEAEELHQVWNTPPQPFRLSIARPGFWDGLVFRPLVRQTPGEGEIEIALTASALNFIDVMKAMGTYPGLDGRSALLGSECAGRVVAVGPGVTAFREGDRVVACDFGTFASHLTVRADHARPIPDSLTDEAAAALPLVMMTAWYGLNDLGRLQPGETVLIHSAAGGLGLAAIEIARLLDARVIATAGTEEKRGYLRDLGIAEVFDSRDLSWKDGVLAATGGEGVDVVLNSLTGAAIPLGLEVLAEDGRFIEVGKKDIYGERNISLAAFKKGISLAAVDLAGLMERRPERFARLFAAVWEQVEAGKLAPLPVMTRTFADAIETLRTMAHGSHIGKFVLTDPDSVHDIAPQPMQEGRFRADATYLVTGGLGALGLSLAEFLADHGAGALVLVGRSAPSADAKRRVEALQARNVRVETLSVDVSDARSLEEALDGLRRRLPPLRGVFHAAGLLDDAMIQNMTAEQLGRVLAPKIAGARHLDQATAGDPLDLFVMFSSAAALVGNAGQSAYAAGNAFMDSLAVARRRKGLPALSVQWGPFTEVGLAAKDGNRGERLAERGMGSFTVEEAWQALVRFLEGDEPVVGYVPLELRQWFDAYPATAAQKSWQLLRQISQEGAPSTSTNEFITHLKSCTESAERHELAESKVRELAGRVLRLDPKTIDHDTPFKALGLDSLMGLELRNRLEAAFGLKLSPTLLWTYGSSSALAGALCERLFSAAAS